MRQEGERAKAPVQGAELGIMPSYPPSSAALYPVPATAFVCEDRVVGYGVDLGILIISRGRMEGADPFCAGRPHARDHDKGK